MNQALDLNCSHCDAPALNPVMARTRDGLRPACCNGCAAAMETIYGLGLEEYYRYRGETRPDKPSDDDLQQLAIFKIEAIYSAFTQQRAQMTEATLPLDGIHCAACVWLIEHALKNEPGLETIQLNLACQSITLKWDNSQTSLYELALRLHQLGYQLRLPSRNPQDKDTVKAHRLMLMRLLLAAIGAMQAMMYATALYMGAGTDMESVYRDFFRYAGLIVATPVVFFSGWPFLQGAYRALSLKQVSMDVAVSLALIMGWGGSIAATVLGSEHVYFESISMFVFFLLGSRYLEQRQQRKVQDALVRLKESLPLAVNRLSNSGETQLTPVHALAVDDIICLKQGDICPADGLVVSGMASIQMAALTGESLPHDIDGGDAIAAGAAITQGKISVSLKARPQDSFLAQVGQLVESAQGRSQTHQQLLHLSGYFVSAVLLLSGTTFAIHLAKGMWPAFEYALAVLVVTCPCALALAAPMTLAATLNRALKAGLLIARPDDFLQLGKVKHIAFDKTGTLTCGQFEVVQLHLLESSHSSGYSLDQLKEIVAALEQDNSHPLAQPLSELASPALGDHIQPFRGGVSGTFDGAHWTLKAAPETVLKSCTKQGSSEQSNANTVLSLFREKTPILLIYMTDRIRPDVFSVLDGQSGRQLHILSGDRQCVVDDIAQALGIAHAKGELAPEDKLALVQQWQAQDEAVLMVGDGINDAAALAQADVSLAMASSSSLARKAASVFLMKDKLIGIQTLFELHQGCQHVLRQNISWALAYNLIAVPMAMAGWIPPWLAAIGMSASSLLVTINASRLNHWRLSELANQARQGDNQTSQR